MAWPSKHNHRCRTYMQDWRGVEEVELLVLGAQTGRIRRELAEERARRASLDGLMGSESLTARNVRRHATPMEPSALVDDYLAAQNAGRIDRCMELIADDAVFDVGRTPSRRQRPGWPSTPGL